MSYRINDHIRSDSRKWAAVTLAILLIIAVIVTGVLTDWFTVWNKYCVFGHDYGENGKCIRCGKDKPAEEQPKADSNVVITPVLAQGMRLNAAPAALADNPDTYTLTATITPASADDKRVNWSVSWKNAGSTWAAGKNASDYVTATPTSEHGLTANVACIKDFGEQILVTVTSLDNAEITASCTVDYVQKITGFKFNMPSLSQTTTEVSYEVETSNYTIASKIEVGSGNYECWLTDEFSTALQNNINKLPYSASNFVEFDSGFFDIVDRKIVFGTYNNETLGNDLKFAPDGIVGCFLFCSAEEFGLCNLTEWDLVSCFKQTIKSVSGNHFFFDIQYTATYNGVTYSSGSEYVYGKFDGAALYIPVTNVSLSYGSLVF